MDLELDLDLVNFFAIFDILFFDFFFFVFFVFVFFFFIDCVAGAEVCRGSGDTDDADVVVVVVVVVVGSKEAVEGGVVSLLCVLVEGGRNADRST